ncbi:response regulator [Candidatus Woesearchaeota archaeon]|nr:response regulator [Candidatus Woesearchaeota archaeon]
MDEGIKGKVLRYLNENPGASSLELSKGIGHNRLTVSKYLQVLRSEGKIDFSVVAQAKIWKLRSGGRKKVLVVDDEPHIVDLVKLTIGDDHDVLEAFSGLDAMEKVYLGSPDLVILDIMMPGIDGYEVCRKIKSNKATAHIPVLFLSAKGKLAEKMDGIDVGAEDYIVKPFDPGELRAMVRSVFDSSDLGRSIGVDPRKELISLLGRVPLEDARLYVFTLNNIGKFQESFGYKRSNEVQRLVSNLFTHRTDGHKGSIAFAGAMGRNRFCVLTGREERFVEGIMEDFESFIPFVYNGQDVSAVRDRIALGMKKFSGSGIMKAIEAMG